MVRLPGFALVLSMLSIARKAASDIALASAWALLQ